MSRDLNVAETFPPGTQVAAYPRDKWPQSSVESGEPPGNVSPTNATVASSGVLSYANLNPGSYIATAKVSGRRRYVRFST